jgi:cell division protein FtsI (penicillin-binding protein 3)
VATTNKKREVMIRIYIGFLCIALLGLGILFKAAQTQIKDGPRLIAEADTLTIFQKTVSAERGNIYSHDGQLLATSLPIFDIHIDFNADGLTSEVFSNTHLDSVCMLMEQRFHEHSASEYKHDFITHRRKKDGFFLLRRNASLADLNAMKTWPWFRLGRNKSGLIIESKELRDHPFGDIALRTLGIDENHDGNYSSGMELKYNKQLTGLEGVKLYRKLSGGASKPLDTRDETPARAGQDIYTTIDINVQDVAEEALRRSLVQHGADHGTVILMEVKTGKIRALANLGRRDSGVYRELRNYGVGEAVEPGSTFKLATAAALMEDGLVNSNSQIDCGNGHRQFYDRVIHDHDAPETPSLTLKRAIEVSSNVAIATWAFNNYSAQPAKFYNHLKDFGFTVPVQVGLPGSAAPVLSEPKQWSGVSSAYIAHGYGVEITPLHTLQFYNTIANGGDMVKPTMIERITEFNQTIDSPTTTILHNHLLSKRTVTELQDILRGVVEHGTATNLKTDYLHIAGKTGTAVITDKNGYNNGGKKYRASFVGYFPAEAPQYSMIVVIHNPSNGLYYGNVVAGTVFREVADKVYAMSLNMHPAVNALAASQYPVVKRGYQEDITRISQFFGQHTAAIKDEWIETTDAQAASYQPISMQADHIPNVKGMGLRDALYLLESRGIHVEIRGNGRVLNQSIEAGEKISKGQKITLQLG